MLVEEHRIGIGDGRCHQRTRVLGRRGADDLQAGRSIEPGFGVLRVIRSGVPQAAPRHPDDHRHRAAPSIANLGRVVHELVEAARDEVVELHLTDRPLAGQRRADADTEHAALGERRVDDAIAELLEERPQQQERVAVLAAHVLAVDEDARIGAKRVRDAESDRIQKCVTLPIERQARRLPAEVAGSDRSQGETPARVDRCAACVESPA